MFLAVLGNIPAVCAIPWPEFMTVSYEAAAEELAAHPLGVYLALTLLIAPLLKKGYSGRDFMGSCENGLVRSCQRLYQPPHLVCIMETGSRGYTVCFFLACCCFLGI